MEHRSGLIVRTQVTPADGHGERDAALVMIQRVPGQHRITVAADKGYDTRDLVAGLRGHARDAACRAAHDQAPKRHRCAHDAPPGLSDQSTEAKAR